MDPLNTAEMGGDAGGGDGGGGGLPAEPEERGALKPIAETTPMERVAGLVAAVAVGTSLAAIVIEQSLIVMAAGVLSCGMGPLSYWQQTRLTDINVLEETHEAVQAEVDRLGEQNNRLKKQTDELEATVGRMEDVENALDAITETQGKSVNAFAQQVELSRNNLNRMKLNRKADVMNCLMDIIEKSDVDGDNIVDHDEVDTMIRRIQNISGVEVHDDRFRETFAGGTVDKLMEVVGNLVRKDIPEEKRIFDFKD